MSEASAGNMLIDAIKKVIRAILKMIALIFAWCFELAGKFLFWISEQIKRNAK